MLSEPAALAVERGRGGGFHAANDYVYKDIYTLLVTCRNKTFFAASLSSQVTLESFYRPTNDAYC